MGMGEGGGRGEMVRSWLLRYREAIMVKWVQMIIIGQLQAVSINLAYAPLMLDEDYELIGRVVWRGERI